MVHFYAISVLAEIFQQVSEQRQLIVATQSVELVNELGPEDVVVMDQKNGASTFRRAIQPVTRFLTRSVSCRTTHERSSHDAYRIGRAAREELGSRFGGHRTGRQAGSIPHYRR